MSKSLYKLLTDQLRKLHREMMESPKESVERVIYRQLCREIETRLLRAQQSA